MSITYLIKDYAIMAMNIPTRINNFHYAITNGDVDMVQRLHKEGADANERDEEGRTLLSHAVAVGNIDIVKYMLDNGQFTRHMYNYNDGSTPLHIASSNGNAELVRLLLSKMRIDVNTRDNYGQSPMSLATQNGHIRIVKCFLEDQASSQISLRTLHETLLYAASRKHMDIVKLLLNIGNNISHKDIILQNIISWGFTDILDLLLENGFSQDFGQYSGALLHLATLKGDTDTVRLLITYKANVNQSRVNTGETALHMAVSKDDVDMVKLLLENNADVNAQTKSKDTSLHLASSRGHLDLVKLLLDYGADTNILDQEGMMSLHVAVASGNMDITKHLLEHNNGINTPKNDGDTPLHLATASGHFNIVRYLISKNAHTNATNKDGETPLHIAASKNRVKNRKTLLKRVQTHIPTKVSDEYINIVQFMVEQGANCSILNNEGDTAVNLATYYGHLDIAILLVEKGSMESDFNTGVRTCLHMASKRGFTDFVEFLLKRGVDSNLTDNNGDTPLHYALLTRELGVAELLCKNGANTDLANDNGETQLHMSVLKGCIENVDLLLRYGANIDAQDKNGETALHKASSSGHLVIIKVLFDKKADSHIQSKNGNSLLHLAVSNGHLDVISLLLEKNVKINASNQEGMVPLHIAVSNGSVEIVQLLTEHGADCNTQDKSGKSSLHFATSTEHLEIITCLLNNKANPNVPNCDGETPIHIAVAKGNIQIVEQLLKSSADSNVATNNWSTPIHLAALNKQIDMIQLLVEYGAQIDQPKKCGKTILQQAVLDRDGNLVKKLIDLGASLFTIDEDNNNILHLAIMSGLFDIIPELLSKFEVGKSIVNQQNINGKTLLHLAAEQGSESTTLLLLEHGADHMVRDGKGQLPADLAQMKGFIDIAQQLMKLNQGISVDEEEEIYTLGDENTTKHFYHILKQYAPLYQISMKEMACSQQTEVFDIRRSIDRLMKKLVPENWNCDVVHVGSMYENTRLFQPDEFDYIFGFQSVVQFQQIKEDKGYAYITGEDPSLPKELCTRQYSRLSPFVFHERFRHCLSQSVSAAYTDCIDPFKEGKLRLKRNFSEGYMDQSAASNIILNWQGTVYKDLDISIDVVPAIKCPKVNFEQNWYHIEGSGILLDSHIYLVPKPPHKNSVFVQKHKHLQQDYLWRLSMAPLESEYIRNLEEPTHKLFMICKFIRSLLPHVWRQKTKVKVSIEDLIPSYYLKVLMGPGYIHTRLGNEASILKIFHELTAHLKQEHLLNRHNNIISRNICTGSRLDFNDSYMAAKHITEALELLQKKNTDHISPKQ
jgi:ankyrin repeat protein